MYFIRNHNFPSSELKHNQTKPDYPNQQAFISFFFSLQLLLLIHFSKSIHFSLRGRNGEQAPGSQWAGSWKAAGPAAQQRLARRSQRASGSGRRPRLLTGPRGCGSGLDAHLAGVAAGAGRAATGDVRRPGLCAGAMSGHSEEPLARSGLSGKPAGGGQWDQGLVSRGAPSSPQPSPTLLRAPPHLHRPPSSSR